MHSNVSSIELLLNSQDRSSSPTSISIFRFSNSSFFSLHCFNVLSVFHVKLMAFHAFLMMLCHFSVYDVDLFFFPLCISSRLMFTLKLRHILHILRLTD